MRRTHSDRGAMRLDPRLIIGMVLVIGSTAGVWALVDSLDDGRSAVVARSTLTPGASLGLGETTSESVRLGGADDAYLTIDDLGDGELIVIRTVEAGELVPRSAVAAQHSDEFATVVVETRGSLPGAAIAGSRVDLWVARPAERGTFEPPVVLVAGAEIAAVAESESMMATEGASVELLVPRDKVAGVLEAIAAGAAVDLVPSGSGASATAAPDRTADEMPADEAD